jgi:photosystem II stability/assembly factor-like uncharacterized protein
MSLRTKFYARLLAALTAASLGFAGFVPAQNAVSPLVPKPNLSSDPWLHSFTFRSIGPAVMMGRLDDIEGTAKDPMLLYIGFATGGLWKSTDGGNHWKSQFDNFANESIGAIAIAPSDPNVVYVGKGEANNRQSASIGDGVWGTTDGGKTWNYLGLKDTQSINRIAVDPTNAKIVFVASPGHLFGPNPERGLYRTTDGGKTWKGVKPFDENTGFNDVAIDPAHPKIVYASSFERRRNGWGYNGGGPNSALWKSTDGGDTWNKLDGPGWPKPKDGLYGRIAISIFHDKPTTIYAQVEAGASAGQGSGTAANGGPEPPSAGGAGGRPPEPPPDPNGNGVYRSDDGGKTWVFVSSQNQRPTYFSQIRVDPKNVNKLLVGGTPGQMSLDGGKTWKGLTASHVDYHAIWINPVDTRIVMIGHDGGLDISNDGGFTWDYHNDLAVGQFYQVSADMRHPYHVCGGLQDNAAWCAPSALRNSTGPMNSDWYSVAGGDGFYTRMDPYDWTIVYAESQDGNMARHDLKQGTQKSIKPVLSAPPAAKPAAAAGTTPPTGKTAAPPPGATKDTVPPPPDEGKGAQVSPAATAAGEAVPAAGGRRGARGATATAGASAPAAEPAAGGFGRQQTPNVSNAPKNIAPARFYWNAPFEISPFDPSVVYMAAQYFFKSTNRGDSWTMNTTDLSKDLPRWAADRPIMGVPGDKPMVAKHDGYSSSSMATQLRESPSRPGVIWIGTDDGNLEVSQDDGLTFTHVEANIPNAPKGYVQVERIEPSHFDPATAYVALNNHRNDDFTPYLYKTIDYGRTWQSVVGDLPAHGSINALREDLVNPDLLFVGTEFGMFITLDGCRTWKPFLNGIPTVRVDDIMIHPRDRDLIVGTHGRSIWILDDITPLEQMKKTEGADLTLFEPRPAIQWRNDVQDQRHGANRVVGSNTEFIGANPQGGTAISVYSKTDLGKAKIEFLQGTKVVGTMDVELKPGLNRYQWNMRGPAPTPAAGAPARPAFPRTEMVPTDPNAPPVVAGATPTEPAEVPFVAASGGGGGFGGGTPQGPLLQPGTYTVRLTAGGKTVTTSVDVLEDTWLAGKYSY